ncbi:hypothetical protein T281_07505 [Rhodomicrobium udaipurense JA643]|uniref:Uncharacterized protein n=1 Tax=Rhodomicrobium udaipurense TaxID=1202716 RepID=A0A8I1GBX3_9HYPH|nr:hypothetical protein [Rhodomicrobium udaipurense]KAI95076.1 hypothetical protein T281_07505 [Rhodomicrobium udaipurense JA643]MBJ7544247.1 hypothetical protein [Rhodomicrobium udaipurense]
MRRYLICCEFHRERRAIKAADCIRRLATDWEHPMTGVWLIRTDATATEIRAALMQELTFRDRVLVCEAGEEVAAFNTCEAGGEKVSQIADARSKSQILTAIFSRNGKASRHLKAATARNLKSA